MKIHRKESNFYLSMYEIFKHIVCTVKDIAVKKILTIFFDLKSILKVKNAN